MARCECRKVCGRIAIQMRLPDARPSRFPDQTSVAAVHFVPDNRLPRLESEGTPPAKLLAVDEKDGRPSGFLTCGFGEPFEDLSHRRRSIECLQRRCQPSRPLQPAPNSLEFSRRVICFEARSLGLVASLLDRVLQLACEPLRVGSSRVELTNQRISLALGAHELLSHGFELRANLVERSLERCPFGIGGVLDLLSLALELAACARELLLAVLSRCGHRALHGVAHCSSLFLGSDAKDIGRR
jgi:hypothetical protein